MNAESNVFEGTCKNVEFRNAVRRIVFVLHPPYASEERGLEIEETGKSLGEAGIAVSEVLWNEETEPLDAKDNVYDDGDGQKDTGVLYLTDASKICRVLRRRGLPVAGYLHGGNAGESFTGVPYILMQPQEVDADSYVKIYQRLAGIPWTITVTERLKIREMGPDDLDSLYKLYDGTACRFLEPPSEDRDKERDILKAYAEKVYGFYGYGMWGMYDRGNGELIGRIGFAACETGDEGPEFGYLVRADYRHQGLGTEAGRAVLDFARDELGMTKVLLYTEKANTASEALAERLGFQREANKSGNENALPGAMCRMDLRKESSATGQMQRWSLNLNSNNSQTGEAT